MEIEETCLLKNLDEAVCLQPEKRVDVRGKRLQGIAESATSTLRLASSSVVLFPVGNKSPGTHCSLIEQKRKKTAPARSATEFEIRGKMEERSGWQGQNESEIVGEKKKNGRLVGAAETSKECAEWCRLQQKNLNILGQLKRNDWPQCHREKAVGKNARATFAKRKRNRAVCPEYQIMRGRESRWVRAPTPADDNLFV